MNTISAILPLLLFVSCSSTAPVTVEPNGPVANVRFAFLGPATNFLKGARELNTTVLKYSSRQCENEEILMTLSNRGKTIPVENQSGIPLNSFAEKSSKELFVPANKEMHYLFAGHSSETQDYYYGYFLREGNCQIPVNISFEEGKSYEMVFVMPNFGECDAVRVSEIAFENGHHVRKSIARFERVVPKAEDKCINAL